MSYVAKEQSSEEIKKNNDNKNNSNSINLLGNKIDLKSVIKVTETNLNILQDSESIKYFFQYLLKIILMLKILLKT